MLQLQQTLTGYPAADVQYLHLQNESLVLYPSGDAIIILNARTLALVRVLAFWEAFPGAVGDRNAISCISVDSGMKLVIAAMGSRLAAWSLVGIKQDAWRVHSTLVLPEYSKVTVLDNDAGLLAVGCDEKLSVYTLVLENDLPTWSRKWTVATPTPITLNFAPSLMYIAAVSKESDAVRLYSTTSGRQTQLIPHPRSVVRISWRRPQASSRDDLIMYTVTSDATLRIFFPVLDVPDYLQLHASLDIYSSLPLSLVEQVGYPGASVFWLDRKAVDIVVTRILENPLLIDDARTTRVKEIKKENWDLFLRVLADGSVVVSAVANLDRRPPTLPQHFTLQQSQPCIFAKPPNQLYLLPNRDPHLLTLITCPPLVSIDLSLLSFLDTQMDGLTINSVGSLDWIEDNKSEVIRFIRTPEGKGVGALRKQGGEVWKVNQHGTKLERAGAWDKGDFVVVLDYGNQFLTYTKDDGIVRLHSSPCCTLHLPGLESLFTMPSSGYDHILGITADFEIFQIRATADPSLNLISQHKLPLPYTPHLVLQLDPMAWRRSHDWTTHDVLLSISEGGEISFWVPEANAAYGWRCTRKVRTGRTGFRKVRCSSAKKTVLIVEGQDGDELTIWDSTESEFASGLEYRGMYKETILDLDWSSTPDMQSILAVGYSHRVDILCQQRMTYFKEGPGWALCRSIDISSFTPYPISDSIWLAHGSFLIAAGQQMYLFSEPLVTSDEKTSESLMEYVARQNGPLEDYHPQMLLQSLIWNKIELVKEVIANLAHAVLANGMQSLENIPVERFLEKEQRGRMISNHKYNLLFDERQETASPNVISFSRPVVSRLIAVLESKTLPNLTTHEQAHLIVLIQTTLEIDEQQRALDANGLRYLISMRSFYIINDRASNPGKTAGNLPNGISINVAPSDRSGRRERLRFRDMIWAFHSESQELLLNASIAACGGKLTWPDARALGIPLWLTSIESLRSQFEAVARNEYMAGDVRDPTRCSIFYFALGKYKLVHGLWRQAAWHQEQNAMLKFLSNDFTIDRWRTAALKNAFALLSKQRFEYATAFFLLGGSLKDAVNVCIKKLGDFQLAISLARITEQSNDGPVLKDILTNTVLPIALGLGNRWLGSWAFWMLHRRDLAVRILLTPLQDIVAAFNIHVTEIGESLYDDPGLALLFSQLRSKTLQAVKGSSEISASAEFNFVLQMARIFCRMGCHVLALDLVRSWSFTQPVLAPRTGNGGGRSIIAPLPNRLLALGPAVRRASILIDMDLSSIPPTRRGSFSLKGGIETQQPTESVQEENELIARRAGVGKLIKSAKHDLQVPEFDMSAFM